MPNTDPAAPPSDPLRYDPSVETPEADESETAAALADTLLSTSKTTCENGGHGLRSVHAKSHGLLVGQLEVMDGLPPVLASPCVTVARITVEPQMAWSPERSKAGDDRLSFSPWRGLAAHRPLGSIMRMRRHAYAMSARFRAERNGGNLVEPDGSFRLPA